jgi:hypothetical protein
VHCNKLNCTLQFTNVYFVMTININLQLRTTIKLNHIGNVKVLTPGAMNSCSIQGHRVAVFCYKHYDHREVPYPFGLQSKPQLRPLQILEQNLRQTPDEA